MKYLLVVFLFLSSHAFAQDYEIIETPFNKFVKLPSVVWAAYANDTLLTTLPDLRVLLIKQMQADKIKTATSMQAGSKYEINIKYLTYKYSFYDGTTDEMPLFDSIGNPIKIIWHPPVYETPKGLLNIAQILYVKNGRLLSTVSHVSPLIDIVNSIGLILGRSEYFATAFNSNPAIASSPKDKIIFLTQTRREIIVDSIKQEDKLKETFGRNLIQCLWPSVISNKSRMYLSGSGKKITGKEIISGKWTGDAVSVPVYDSLGNLSESKTFYPEVSAKSFKKIEITQTWFYNETKNIVFNKIPEIILFANIKDSSGNTELKPAIKIVF
jgi:hypothetical protein